MRRRINGKPGGWCQPIASCRAIVIHDGTFKLGRQEVLDTLLHETVHQHPKTENEREVMGLFNIIIRMEYAGRKAADDTVVASNGERLAWTFRGKSERASTHAWDRL